MKQESITIRRNTKINISINILQALQHLSFYALLLSRIVIDCLLLLAHCLSLADPKKKNKKRKTNIQKPKRTITFKKARKIALSQHAFLSHTFYIISVLYQSSCSSFCLFCTRLLPKTTTLIFALFSHYT